MVTAAWRVVLALVAMLAWPAVRSSAQGVTIDTSGDALKIRAPGFSFLKGEPLVRLKDGRTVRVELSGLVLPGPGKSPVAAARRVFALSYDLWEERFAVTTVEARPQSVSHLAQAAVEAWCVDHLTIPLAALAALGRDQQFWIRLEYRFVDSDGDTTGRRYLAAAIEHLSARARRSVDAPQCSARNTRALRG